MKNKFAVFSHVLPPSDSGQAVMLYRILENFPKNSYILLSNKDYRLKNQEPKSSRKLPTKYYFLEPILKLNLVTRFFWDIFFLHRATLFIVTVRSMAKEIRGILKKENCQTLIACTGGFFDLPAAYLAARKSKINFVIYSFDDYIYQWTGIARLIARATAFLAFRRADRLIVPNEFLQKEYEKRFRRKSVIVRNPYLPIKARKSPIKLDSKHINIVYTGSVYFAHFDAFKNLISAMGLVKKPTKLHIFTGQDKEKLKKEGIFGENIVFHPNINQTQICTIQRQADILFLPLAFKSPIPEVIKTSAPGKIGEYLASGVPILVHAPADSFLSWYFNRKKAGVVVGKDNIEELAEGILKIFDKNFAKKLTKNAKIAAPDFSIDIAQKNFLKTIKF